MDESALATLSVCVVYSPQARTVLECKLSLPQGATVADALQRSGIGEILANDSRHADCLGIWGRKVNPAQTLSDGDRVEIYRPLRVDPKVARRERFQKQGARSAGLFAKRRDNTKPGY